MSILIVSLSVLFGIVLILFSGKVKGQPTQANLTNRSKDSVPYESLFKKYSEEYDIDWRLLAAIAFIESSYDPNAINKADNESIGLMQILCNPDGKGGCKNNFNISDWKSITREKLFDPDMNIKIGSQILAWNISQYGVPKGIAVYNAWSARNSLDEGPFPNQTYVNKVLQYAKGLGYATTDRR